MNKDFKAEQDLIKQKLKKYSKAIREGRSAEEAAFYANSDDILKKRLNPARRVSEADSIDNQIKEDLLRVRLEPIKKQNFLNIFKRKKQISIQRAKEENKIRKINEESSFNKQKFLKANSKAYEKKESSLEEKLKADFKEKERLKKLKSKALFEKEQRIKGFRFKLTDIFKRKKDIPKKLQSKENQPNIKEKKAPISENELSSKEKLQRRCENEKRLAFMAQKTAQQIKEKKAKKLNKPEQIKPKREKQIIHNFTPIAQQLHGKVFKTPKPINAFKPKKAEPLDELLFDDLSQNYEDLSPACLLSALFGIFFTTIFFAFTIYIRTQIYYQSRDIALLKEKERVLKQENKNLNRYLENMRFQNQILDYLK